MFSYLSRPTIPYLHSFHYQIRSHSPLATILDLSCAAPSSNPRWRDKTTFLLAPTLALEIVSTPKSFFYFSDFVPCTCLKLHFYKSNGYKLYTHFDQKNARNMNMPSCRALIVSHIHLTYMRTISDTD
jgi:hypothetical protein